MYKSPFFPHETGQNQRRKQFQMSTQSKSICLELKQPLLRYLQGLQNWNHWVICTSSSGFSPLGSKTDGRSFHLIQLPNLPSATNHAISQPLCTESTSREGPGMLSHHSLTVRSQPWCCFKAFRPCRPWDCILTCHPGFGFYFCSYLETHVCLSGCILQALKIPNGDHPGSCALRKDLHSGQASLNAEPQVLTSEPLLMCLFGALYIFAQGWDLFSFSLDFFNASLINASWHSLNTWICSSCRLTYLKFVGETSSLEDISKSKAMKSWEVCKGCVCLFFFF